MIDNTVALLQDFQMTAEDKSMLEQCNVKLPMGYGLLKKYLPHRYPFMLIDRVISCRPNKNIIGYKNISINEPYFQGHFPDEPIFPGVLIVEAMAQLSGILGFISQGVTYEDGYLFLFAGVDKARFKHPVTSGDRLVMTSQQVVHKRDIYKFDCQALVDEVLIATAQLTIIRQPRPPK